MAAGDQEEPEFGLGVAQIVITAATPVAEEPDRQFPPSEDEENQKEEGQEAGEEKEQQEQTKQPQKKQEQPEDASEPEKEETVVESPESPQSPPKQVQGGRASIPDELEPDQLARLQDLKESNA